MGRDDMKFNTCDEVKEALEKGLIDAGESPAQRFSRTQEGIFDLSGLAQADGVSLFEAAGRVYPCYAAFETVCGKKAGYPDLLEQMKVWNRKLAEEYTFANVSFFLKMLIDVIDNLSQEIYEYYRELVAIFKENTKKAIDAYYKEGTWQGGDERTERLLREAVGAACDHYVLLAEKYSVYR